MCQDKKFSLDIPRMGYFILFRHERGFLGNQIMRIQRKKGFTREHARYTHVGVSGGGQWMVQVSPPRIRVIDITKVYKNKYIRIVSYKNEMFDKKRYKVSFWAATHSNLGYDWFGVLRFKLKFLFHQKRMFFCSESSMEALQKEFPKAMRAMKPQNCMPAHFLDPKYFETIWEGTVKSINL